MRTRSELELATWAEWFRVLGHPRCLQVFVALIHGGPLDRTQLAEHLAVSPELVSSYLREMLEVGLVDRSVGENGELLHSVAEDPELEGCVLWLRIASS